MKKMISLLTVFLIGGGLYGCLEVLWRGYTHPSMVIVGGLALLFIYEVDCLRMHLLLKMLLCGAGITVLEGISGVLLNLVWHLDVWDYSHLYGNLMGQVCPLFSFFWVLLSFPGLLFCRFLRRHIFA